MPNNLYRDYFCPDYKIHMQVSNIENQNTFSKIEELNKKILENLKKVSPPSPELSSYVNGGGRPSSYNQAIDFKLANEIREEQNKDRNTDKKDLD